MQIPDEVLAEVIAGALLLVRMPESWSVQQIAPFVEAFRQTTPPAVLERTLLLTAGFEVVAPDDPRLRALYETLRRRFER